MLQAWPTKVAQVWNVPPRIAMEEYDAMAKGRAAMVHVFATPSGTA